MGNVKFVDGSLDEFIQWSIDDKKTFKKIHALIKDIERHPFVGVGKPEPLKYNRSGEWSRRINQEDRLVYKIVEDDIFILSCKGHY